MMPLLLLPPPPVGERRTPGSDITLMPDMLDIVRGEEARLRWFVKFGIDMVLHQRCAAPALACPQKSALMRALERVLLSQHTSSLDNLNRRTHDRACARPKNITNRRGMFFISPLSPQELRRPRVLRHSWHCPELFYVRFDGTLAPLKNRYSAFAVVPFLTYT